MVAITRYPASKKLRCSRGNTRRDDHTFGLFIVEKKAEVSSWSVRSTHRTVRAAEDRAWDLLTREGGEVRVRQGSRIVAQGAGYAPSGAP